MLREQFLALARHYLSRPLHFRAKRDGHVGAEAKAEVVRVHVQVRPEHGLWRRFQRDDHFGGGHGQALPRADVKRHPGPSPVINMQAHGGKSLHCRVRSDACFLAVARVLPAHYRCRVEHAHRLEHGDLGVARRFRRARRGRLHREQRDHLQAGGSAPRRGSRPPLRRTARDRQYQRFPPSSPAHWRCGCGSRSAPERR